MTENSKTRPKTATILKGDFTWHGPDRRKLPERRIRDRRAEVRYEPEKDDRRQPLDRRQDDDRGKSFRKAKHPQRDDLT